MSKIPLALGQTCSKVFIPEKLRFGLLTPLEGYPTADTPTMERHTDLARQADALGFSALWLRDGPFRDPIFGDVAQIFDPMVYTAWLASATKRIAIGTAGSILPLRDPIAVAKQAMSVDQLSNGRFLLGVSTGDRPSEYPAFGKDFESRDEMFRDAYSLIHTVMNRSFPTYKSSHYGHLDGSLDLIPRSFGARLPIIAVGRCGQGISWLGRNMDGWIWHQSNIEHLPKAVEM